jgi:hypothetical protein
MALGGCGLVARAVEGFAAFSCWPKAVPLCVSRRLLRACAIVSGAAAAASPKTSAPMASPSLLFHHLYQNLRHSHGIQ